MGPKLVLDTVTCKYAGLLDAEILCLIAVDWFAIIITYIRYELVLLISRISDNFPGLFYLFRLSWVC